jgi:hypothetical protein
VNAVQCLVFLLTIYEIKPVPDMANQLLYVGIAGGLAIAVGLAALLSAALTQSTAQMMNHQGMMDQGMMNTQSSGAPWQWDQRSMFSANGMSSVNDVQVTGLSITGDDEITVDLRYGGSGASPAVTVIAMTNYMSMMQGSSGMGGMMQGGQSGMMMQPGMQGGWIASPAWQNNTQWQQWHAQMAQWHGQLNSTQWSQMQAWHNAMMAQGAMGPGSPWWNEASAVALQPQTGSSVLDAGWTSGSVTVRLEGGSAYDSKDVRVMVFPLTS